MAHEHGSQAGEDSRRGHSHTHGVSDERRIGWAFIIIFVFMFVEGIGGIASGSLALIADAGHMVSDAAALGLSWVALRLGRRQATATLSYGYKRFEILAAFVNGCTLFLIAAWIVVEAVKRFSAPVPVMGGTMLAVAVSGLAAGVVAFLVLNGGNRENLNMKSAWLHVLGDILGFVVAIVGAGVIMLTGWTPVDPILSIVVALLILKSAWSIVRSSAHILLEGTPEGLSIEAIKTDLEENVDVVEEAHHIHAWSVTSERVLLTLHVRPTDNAATLDVIAAVQKRLRERFDIAHVTIQVEPAPCSDPESGELPELVRQTG